MFDDPFFGGGFGRRKRVSLRTKDLEIEAKPLPEEGKPKTLVVSLVTSRSFLEWIKTLSKGGVYNSYSDKKEMGMF